MKNEDKKKVKIDLRRNVDIYQTFLKELQSAEGFLFQLKIALGGIILIIAASFFSDAQSFQSYSSIFKISFIIILTAVIVLFIEESFYDIKEKTKNTREVEENALLSSIRYHALILSEREKEDPNRTRFLKIGQEAERRYNDSVQISSDIKEGLSVDDILNKNRTSFKWKLRLFIWTALALLVPIILFYEFLLSK